MITAWTPNGRDTLEINGPINKNRLLDTPLHDEKSDRWKIKEKSNDK
ncbi:MAG: hypothetical protein KAS66_05185 [Candidatus Omnitrophica bacterium]|nr:hypothetical protein [Candidatus Omnitrophota bacterium]